MFISFWLTSLCIIGSRFIHLIKTDSNVFIFYGWVIFQCVYVPQPLYPFICRWTSRWLPCSSYCNSAALNNGVHVSFSVLVSSGYISRSGIAGSYGGFIPSLIYCFWWLYLCGWTLKFLLVSHDSRKYCHEVLSVPLCTHIHISLEK